MLEAANKMHKSSSSCAAANGKCSQDDERRNSHNVNIVAKSLSGRVGRGG